MGGQAIIGDDVEYTRDIEKEKKKKEQQDKKRSQLELLMSDYQGKEGFNLKKDKDREVTRRATDSEDLNVMSDASILLTDDRFRKFLVEDPDANIDPTHSKFQKTGVTKKLAD